MTDQVAFWFALVIVAAIGLDLFFYGTEHMIFLGKKFYEFLEWIAFWR
ncbi:MAG: hypothetical protein AB3N23_03145 [Paracoccaceae bacterium]